MSFLCSLLRSSCSRDASLLLSHAHLPFLAPSPPPRWPADSLHSTIEKRWANARWEALGDLYSQDSASTIDALLSQPGARVLDVGCERSGEPNPSIFALRYTKRKRELTLALDGIYAALWLCSVAVRFPKAECVGVDTQPISLE